MQEGNEEKRSKETVSRGMQARSWELHGLSKLIVDDGTGSESKIKSEEKCSEKEKRKSLSLDRNR